MKTRIDWKKVWEEYYAYCLKRVGKNLPSADCRQRKIQLLVEKQLKGKNTGKCPVICYENNNWVSNQSKVQCDRPVKYNGKCGLHRKK